MDITVNGRPRTLPPKYKRITYDEIVVLAYGPTGPEAVHTITYFHPKAQGSINRGETLTLKRGMRITCVQTNKA